MTKYRYMAPCHFGLEKTLSFEVKKIGGDMVVINPNKNVMKILKLAGAERMIKIEKVDLDRKKDLDGKER